MKKKKKNLIPSNPHSQIYREYILFLYSYKIKTLVLLVEERNLFLMHSTIWTEFPWCPSSNAIGTSWKSVINTEKLKCLCQPQRLGLVCTFAVKMRKVVKKEIPRKLTIWTKSFIRPCMWVQSKATSKGMLCLHITPKTKMLCYLQTYEN